MHRTPTAGDQFDPRYHWKFEARRSGNRIMRTLLAAIVLVCLRVAAGHTQVVRDGSIGPGASVQPVGPVFEITEAMGESAGSNLFHSFSQFTFGAQESVVFSASSAIANIFARVTGGFPSVIGGRLAAPGNLFLINPFGFMFDRTARVDVPGAFHLTTADFIEFETGETFFASPRGASILSAAPPSYFGFLSANPRAPIEVRSDLGSSGNPVSLIGGPATFEGGRILAVRGDGYSDVTINRGSDTVRLDRVFIRGGKITLTGGDIRLSNSEIQTVTHDIDSAGSVERAGLPVAVEIRSSGVIDIDKTLILSDTSGEGRAGSISIHANGDLVSNESRIEARGTWDGLKRRLPASFDTDPTDYRGDVGSILLTANRDLTLRASNVINWDYGDATGGTIALSAGRDVRVTDGSRVASAGGSERLGPVWIQSGRDLRVTDSFVRSGAPHQIVSIRRRSAVLMRAAGSLVLQRSSISTRAEPYRKLVYYPEGGNYWIDNITIPGPVTFEGRTIELTESAIDGSELFDVFDFGSTITLNATERVSISRSSVESSGRGKPGQIHIAAPRVSVVDESRIESLNIAGNDPGRVVDPSLRPARRGRQLDQGGRRALSGPDLARRR